MSSHFKLFARIGNDGVFKPYPGQGGEEVFGFNPIAKKTSVPPNLLNKLKLAADGDLDTIHVLAEISNDGETVLSIAEVVFETTISITRTESNKRENIRVAEKIKNNITLSKKYQPIPDNLFIPAMTWQLLLSSFDFGLYPMILGPKGNGKTTTAYEIANSLGYKFFKVDCGTLFKPKSTLIGSNQAKEGSTYLVKSEFLSHYTSENKVLIFLDEISRIPSQASNYMMTIVDANNPHIYVDEEAKVYKKGKNVVFVAAGNFGPEYTDARVLDGALDDRFMKFYLDYLDEDEELALIKKKLSIHPQGKSITDDSIRKLIWIANAVREGVKEKDLMTNISTRKLIHMSYFLIHGFTTSDIITHLMRNLFKQDENELEYFDQITTAGN